MHYKELRQINVSQHIEKKNGLSYLSWSWALDQLLQLDNDATWEYLEPKQFGESLMVFCKVTAFGKSRTAQLPVMDFRNRAILNPNAYEVNTAMQRCLAKAISLHGIGLYIYAGEDLPEGETASTKVEAPKLSAPAVGDALPDLKKGTSNWDAVVKYVTSNKALGIEKIGAQITRKYKVSPALKKEIANLLTAE